MSCMLLSAHNAVTAWVKKHGYTYQIIINNTIENKPVGILIDTDYYSVYPPPEVYAEHARIREYCKRTGRKYEAGTMHVGARVYF